MYDRLKYMTDGDKRFVHECAVEILSESGMWFESPEVREIFKEHGFKTDNQKVFFTERQIEKALETVPAEFDLIAPNPDKKIRVGGDTFHFATSASSTRIIDLNGVCRDCSSYDYEDALKIQQTLDEIDFMFEYLVAQDLPGDTQLLWNLFAQMHIIDKPLSCQTTAGIGLLEIFYDTTRDKMRESARNGLAYGITMTNPISPLGMSGHESGKLIACAQSGIAVAVAPMALAGMTAPITLEGLIIQQNAEILGTLTLTQLVSPGAPVVYGCLGAISNMRNMMAPVGSAEGRVIEHAAAQMARWYKLPSRSLAGMTDSNEIDYQAGAESMLNFVQTARSGVNVITALGSFANWMIASFEKLLLDAECVAYVKRLLRPMEFSPEKGAADVIKAVGAKGSYIMEDHTLDHFRTEFYEPACFERQPYDTFVSKGRIACAETAKTRAAEIIKSFNKPVMEASLDKKLREYCIEYGLEEFIKNRF